jgi:hypothetical protein
MNAPPAAATAILASLPAAIRAPTARVKQTITAMKVTATIGTLVYSTVFRRSGGGLLTRLPTLMGKPNQRG